MEIRRTKNGEWGMEDGEWIGMRAGDGAGWVRCSASVRGGYVALPSACVAIGSPVPRALVKGGPQGGKAGGF